MGQSPARPGGAPSSTGSPRVFQGPANRWSIGQCYTCLAVRAVCRSRASCSRSGSRPWGRRAATPSGVSTSSGSPTAPRRRAPAQALARPPERRAAGTAEWTRVYGRLHAGRERSASGASCRPATPRAAGRATPTCSGATPACWNGACVACEPGAVQCSGNGVREVQRERGVGHAQPVRRPDLLERRVHGHVRRGHDAVPGRRRADVHSPPGQWGAASPVHGRVRRGRVRRLLHPRRAPVLGQRRPDVRRERACGARPSRASSRRASRACARACASMGETQCSGNGVATCGANGQWGRRRRLHEPDVRRRRLHGRVRAEPGAVQRQHAADVQRERDVDERGRVLATRRAWPACAPAAARPGQTQCLGTAIQSCDGTGNWRTQSTLLGRHARVPEQHLRGVLPRARRSARATASRRAARPGPGGRPSRASDQTCIGGACTGVCAPGQTQCTATACRRCTSSGTWGTAAACVGSTCVSGVCTGTCTPGAVQCSGNSDADLQRGGTWGTPSPAPARRASAGRAWASAPRARRSARATASRRAARPAVGDRRPPARTRRASTACAPASCAPGPGAVHRQHAADLQRERDVDERHRVLEPDVRRRRVHRRLRAGPDAVLGNLVQTCSATGAWQTQATCSGSTPACLNERLRGVLAGRRPSARATASQTCSASGSWGAAVACTNQTCISGACTGVCAPGQTQCTGNGVETCTASGTWGTAVGCTNSACVTGACTGTCAPGAMQCSGNGVQTCSAGGTWGAADRPAPTRRASRGACPGVCAPGQMQCAGNGVETCGASGTWGSPVACTNQACVAGACTGVCAPGATQCSGNGVETCSASGHVGPRRRVHEPDVRSAASARGRAPRARRSARATACETCNASGSWGTASACTNQTCVGGVCTGSCAPGADAVLGQRGGDVQRERAVGTAVACASSACVAGVCTGTCAPGAVQCSGNGVETCSASGAWGTAVACSNGTCTGGVCVPYLSVQYLCDITASTSQQIAPYFRDRQHGPDGRRALDPDGPLLLHGGR